MAIHDTIRVAMSGLSALELIRDYPDMARKIFTQAAAIQNTPVPEKGWGKFWHTTKMNFSESYKKQIEDNASVKTIAAEFLPPKTRATPPKTADPVPVREFATKTAIELSKGQSLEVKPDLENKEEREAKELADRYGPSSLAGHMARSALASFQLSSKEILTSQRAEHFENGLTQLTSARIAAGENPPLTKDTAPTKRNIQQQSRGMSR